MKNLGTAELTLQERGILATYACYVDDFSSADRAMVNTVQLPVLRNRDRRYYSRGRAVVITWQDIGQPLPKWFDPLMQGFVDLLTLPPNWDSYDAVTIEPKADDAAMAFIHGLLGPMSAVPRVVPLADGGLQLEWHRHGIDLEIVFENGEQPYFFHKNRITDEESDYALPENNHLLKSIIARLTE